MKTYLACLGCDSSLLTHLLLTFIKTSDDFRGSRFTCSSAWKIRLAQTGVLSMQHPRLYPTSFQKLHLIFFWSESALKTHPKI